MISPCRYSEDLDKAVAAAETPRKWADYGSTLPGTR